MNAAVDLEAQDAAQGWRVDIAAVIEGREEDGGDAGEHWRLRELGCRLA